jgi:hypothetical protein
LYGAWYCSRAAVGAVAECIQVFRGQALDDQDFQRRDGLRKALVAFDADDDLPVVDLDDPGALVRRRLRPSQVATPRREVTQRMARAIFEEGAAGIGWCSVLDADWAHVTLFHERARARVTVSSSPEWLSVALPVVREAAARLGVRC